MAIKELMNATMDSVDKILIGMAYSGATRLLLDGCSELAKRESTISRQEGQRLGVDTVARLCKIREDGLRGTLDRLKSLNSKKSNRKLREEYSYDYEGSVRSEFSQELAGEEIVADFHNFLRATPQVDDGAMVSSSAPSQHERFYMESIVFQVRRKLSSDVQHMYSPSFFAV